MQKKSLIKSHAATKKALIASRKGTTGKVNSANVAAGVAVGKAPSASIKTGAAPAASVPTGVTATGAMVARTPTGSVIS